MYREYLFHISDYFCLLTKNEAWFEFLLPFLIGVVAFVRSLYGVDLYNIVTELIQVLEILLGFLLAALALFVTINTDKIKLLQQHKIEKKLNDEDVSLYKRIIIEFSYLIFVVSTLCISYLLGLIVPCCSNLLASICNSVFIFISFHVLFSIVRTLTSLSFILQKE